LEWTWSGLSKLLGEAVTMREHAAFDLRPSIFVPISQSSKKGPTMVEEGLGSSQHP
jgi:hypothetical protein